MSTHSFDNSEQHERRNLRRKSDQVAERMLLELTKAATLSPRDAEPAELFNSLLAGLLDLTESDYGYIGEVLYDDGKPFLRTWAITDISWNEETKALYETFVVQGQGLEFRNLDTLFGWGLVDGGRLVICNDTSSDPRSSGRPGGHPPLNSYLGVPVLRSGELVGQLGVANRKGGYSEQLIEVIEPFVKVVGSLIDAYRTDRQRRQAEADRDALQRRQASILEHVNDVVTLLSPDGTGTANLAGRRLLGYDEGYVPPGGLLELVHPDDHERAVEIFESIGSGVRTGDEPFLLRVRAADGSYRTLEMVVSDARDDPSLNGFLLTSHDVTVLQQAEQAAQDRLTDLGALLDAFRDAVLFDDHNFEVVFMNQLFCDLWGYQTKPEDLVGTMTAMDSWLNDRAATTDPIAPRTALPRPSPMSIVKEPETFAAGIEAAYAGGVPDLGVRVELNDGRILERDYLPVQRYEQRRGHLWIYRDITAREEIERERSVILEQERERNRSLLELDRLKTEFVATVSHELRTPLTSIVSFAELLNDETAVSDEQREFVDIINRNAGRLLHLVDELLLIAQLESGRLVIDPKPMTLAPLVGEVIAAFGPEIEAKHLKLELDLSVDPTPVHIDDNRFERVIRNLVSNAIKFTPEAGQVKVSTRREQTDWVFAVSDTGIGIAADDLDRLFERFFRTSNARLQGIPGSGLGLAIVRAIVDLHGGSISVTSSDKGTTIEVRLPDRSPSIVDRQSDDLHPKYN